MTWCTDVSVIPEHGMSISGSASPSPIWIDQTDQTLPRYCSKKALAARYLTFIHSFIEKVYICTDFLILVIYFLFFSTKLQATCFEEFFVNILSRPSHDILQSPNYVFMSNLVTRWIQIDFMLHISSHAYAQKVNLSQCVPQKYD